jgi:hypothetical protein
MINQTHNGNNALSATNSVETDENENQKKETTKVSVVSKSKILETNLAIANTSTPTNENLKPDLIQRTIGPVNTDLTDFIEQEIANDPTCKVYFISTNLNKNPQQVRFSEVVQDKLYKAGISKAEVDDALILTRGTANNKPCYYVGNLKINHHIEELLSENKEGSTKKLSQSDVLEFYNTQIKAWKKVYFIDSSTINKTMLDPRYIQISNIYDENSGQDFIDLIANKEKFIADRVAQYLSTTLDLLRKELYSKKTSEEKIAHLQAIVSPDCLLSNDSSQEEIPYLSAERLLDRLNFAPNGMEYNLLVQSNPKYREGTI